MAIYRKRQKSKDKEPRPFVFPSLKVDEQVYQREISIPNIGQGLDAALGEAVQMIRDKRAEQDVESVRATEDSFDEPAVEEEIPTVPASEDSEESNNPNSGDSLVDVRPLLSTEEAGEVVIPWLQANLPSADQLMAASASMIALIGVEQRTKDLLDSMRGGFVQVGTEFRSWFTARQSEWTQLQTNVASAITEVESSVAELLTWKRQLESELRAIQKSMIGPTGAKGSQGNWGAVCLVSDKTPSGADASLMQRFIDRDAIKGDTLIDGTNKMRYAWMFDGTAFQRGPSMVTMEIRDVRVTAADMSTKVQVTQAITQKVDVRSLRSPLTNIIPAGPALTPIFESIDPSIGFTAQLALVNTVDNSASTLLVTGVYDAASGSITTEYADLNAPGKAVPTVNIESALKADGSGNIVISISNAPNQLTITGWALFTVAPTP